MAQAPAIAALFFALACGAEPPIRTDDRAPFAHDAGRPSPSSDEPIGDPSRTGSSLCAPEGDRCDGFGDERPGRLSEHSAVYDAEGLQMIVFGGTASVPLDCGPGAVEFEDALWIYDDPCGRWRRLDAPGPSARGRHLSAFGGGKMWLFGGRYREGSSGFYELYYDLWSFDPPTQTWRHMPTAEQRPTARINGALAFDESRGRIWLMGGNQSEHGTAYLPTNDVWSYSVETESWQLHNTSVGPSPRFFHAATVDPTRDWLVVFGGADEAAFVSESGYSGDLWALDLETLQWEELAPQGSGPDGRFWSQLVHDASNDGYVLFGGHDDAALGNRNDIWRFDPDAGSWSRLASEDTFGTEPRGACDFPSDFATIAVGTPERRHAHGLVWSAPCRHALLFAGKTDCGASDDVWRFSESGWNARNPAREGETCARSSPDPAECGNLCF